MRAWKTCAFTLAVLAFGAAEGAAQTGTISGRVLDPAAEPLAGVQVEVEGTELGSISSETGGFVVQNVPAGDRTITANLLGYETASQRIDIRRDGTTFLEITLSERAIEMSEIRVVVFRADSDYVDHRASTATKTDAPMIETPRSVSVISSEQLDVQESTSLAEALWYTPGIQGEPFGIEPRFTFLKLRGFIAYTTGFYRDGLQLRNPGFAVGYDFEPYGAERIGVLRGPASTLYGAGSPGGLVNFVSKRPVWRSLTEVEIEGGSHEMLQGKVDVGGPIDEAGRLAYRLTGLLRESDTQVDFIGNDRTYLAPALEWRPGEATSLTFFGHYQKDESRSSQALPAEGTIEPNPHGEIPVDLFTGEPDIDRYDREEYTLTYQLEHRAGDTWNLRQKARYYVSDVDEVTVFSTGLAEDDRTLSRAVFGSFGELDGFALDNHAEAGFDTGALSHDVLVGLDYQRVEASSEQTFGSAPPLDIFDPRYGVEVADPPPFKDAVMTEDQIGLYLQDRVDVGGGWILDLGGRYDWASHQNEDLLNEATTEQDDEEFSGHAGLTFVSDLGLAPYVSYSESFLPVIGTTEAGDPFEPEKGEQVEIGVKYQPIDANAFVTLVWYDLTRENVVQFDPATFVPVQTGEINSTGLEIEAVASLESGLSVIATFTQMDVEITESNVAEELGERPTGVPDRMASIWAEYQVREGDFAGLGLGAGVRHQGETFGSLPNTVEVDGFTLADATVYYDWGNARLGLTAHNVFDEEHVASCFPRGGTFCTFGQTRAVLGSLRYRW